MSMSELLTRSLLPQVLAKEGYPELRWKATLYLNSSTCALPQVLAKEGYPELRTMLVMGGIDPKLQYETLKAVSTLLSCCFASLFLLLAWVAGSEQVVMGEINVLARMHAHTCMY